MNALKNQFETEENMLRDNLRKAGYSSADIESKIAVLKNTGSRKNDRNIVIREIALVLKKRPCALQAWFVQELISKITGLSPKYIQVISNSRVKCG